MFGISKIRSTIVVVFFLTWAIPSSSSLALTDDEKNNVAVYQKASSSVVNVISSVITRDFFLNPIPREGSGSGSLIDSKGYILTNNHVIKDARKLELTLADGS
jgi:S1-C subfamily serine protease